MRDQEVVASIVAGDPAGLAEAYDKYARVLYSYSKTFLREPADAADVVHDTFVIAAVSLRQLRDPQRLRPWLYAVARNLALRKLRAAKAAAVYPALGADGDVDGNVGGDGDVGDDVERAELRALLLAATGGLNSREREIIELRLWQGLDIAETAALAAVLRGIQRDRGMAVLLVEHDMEMVRTAVDRVVVLDVGEIIAEGSFAAVVADPEVRRAYLGRSA